MKFLPASAVTLLLLFCYWLVIRSPHFESDDAYIIYLASTWEWHRFLYVPAIYQQLSAAHLTPLTVPFYSLVQAISPFSPDAFLNTLVVLLGSWILICSAFLRSHFKLSERYIILFVVMLLSVASTGTLLSRFYTAHYLLGGIFGTASLLALSYYSRTQRSAAYLIAVALMLLALLSKEILVAILPISLIVFISDRRLAGKILATAIFAGLAYLAYRGYMLGELMGGRAAGNGLSQGLATILETLPGFLKWYASNRGLLLLALVCTLFLSPQTSLAGLTIAAMLAAPALAAPHGFSHPELHGDRLFIASDFALAATVTLSLARWRFLEHLHGHPLASTAVGTIIIASLATSLYQTHLYDTRAQDSLEYRITRTILEHEPFPTAIYLPENYPMGSMIVALKKHDPRLREVTADCFEALQWKDANNLLFDSDGQPLTREELAHRCISFDPPPTLNGEVIFDKGVLRWNIIGSDQLAAGVYFPGHAFFIGARQFEERLIRPAAGEKYKLYAHDGVRWWFSEEKEVIFR
ncbi:hypothetical protein [Nitrosomonas sp. Nm132]|jgi:hypothetical protein|uniref:hypothetical protein n=1 Tax=Nitrosomonas sp. Nm132 TaxID=1881053 RepID=UPI00088F753F|nr:hypothetical protein [Nitrosomonas sp. Nm132]SDH74602.1 hypothetical protein SAMN05428952_102811 [Nitrosomonas sp. Nm132]